MNETEKIEMKASLMAAIQEWLNHQDYPIHECDECARMMATAALAVLEASTVAEREGAEERDQ